MTSRTPERELVRVRQESTRRISIAAELGVLLLSDLDGDMSADDAEPV